MFALKKCVRRVAEATSPANYKETKCIILHGIGCLINLQTNSAGNVFKRFLCMCAVCAQGGFLHLTPSLNLFVSLIRALHWEGCALRGAGDAGLENLRGQPQSSLIFKSFNLLLHAIFKGSIFFLTAITLDFNEQLRNKCTT